MRKDLIQNTIENLLEKTTISYNEIVVSEEDGVLVFMIMTDEDHFLIGNNGSNLIAFNHVIRRVLEKKLEPEERINFSIDANNYQKEKREDLKNKIKIISDRVKSFCVDIEMEPMSAYERMLVHSALAEDNELETESTGFGKDRRVIIKLKKQ